MCKHENFIRSGYDRKGKQRVRCKDCGHAWRNGDDRGKAGLLPIHRLKKEKDLAVRELIVKGLTVRAISAKVHVSHNAVIRRLREVKPRPFKKMCKRPSMPDECDWCGAKIKGEREFFRKTSRTSHKFCDQDCYHDYYDINGGS